MDTLLYVGQIMVGTALLVLALALTGRLPARFGTVGTPMTTCSDAAGTRSTCRFGLLFSSTAIVFGVTGLLGLSPLPAAVGVLITGMGLISVLLATDTTPMFYRPSDSEFSVPQAPATVPTFDVLPEPRYSVEAVLHAPRESRQAA